MTTTHGLLAEFASADALVAAARRAREAGYTRLEAFEESQLTFMVYLNDQMTGGETRFFTGLEEAFQRRPYLVARPKTGMALVFEVKPTKIFAFAKGSFSQTRHKF